MDTIITAVLAGIAFALGGLMCFGVLIGIGEIIAWYERRQK